MIKILLAGEGGQGIQTIAKIIAKTAQIAGKQVTYIPSFGVEQRGGVSLAYIIIDTQPISYPRFEKADIIVAFCNRAISSISSYINFKTIFIYDNSYIENFYLNKVSSIVKKFIPIPAREIAMKKYSIKTLNMVMLGAVMSQVEEIGLDVIEKTIDEELKDKIAKKPEIKIQNLFAIKDGLQIATIFKMDDEEMTGIEPKNIEQSFSDDKKTWTRFPKHCKGCSLCIDRCPVKALKFSKELGFLGNPIPEVDIKTCIACGMCENTCPDGAIRVDRK